MQSALKTIAIKENTYIILQQIKVKYRFKNFDEVIEYLIKSSGELVSMNNTSTEANSNNVVLGEENRIEEKIRLACYELYKQSKSKEIMFYISLLKHLHLKKKITLTTAELSWIKQHEDMYVNCEDYLKDVV